MFTVDKDQLFKPIFWKHSKFAMLNRDSESKLTVFKVLNT